MSDMKLQSLYADCQAAFLAQKERIAELEAELAAERLPWHVTNALRRYFLGDFKDITDAHIIRTWLLRNSEVHDGEQ